MPAKKGVLELQQMKRAGEKIAWLTAYDYPTATFEQEAGVDMILVGDSLGMCVYGYPGTVPVTMDQCIVHCEAVRRAAPDVFVVGDMPFMSYQVSDEEAVRNAGRFLKEAGVDAIKLEGGVSVISRVKAILDAGIVVCGHIGLTPQSSGQLGGHKAQGRTLESAKLVVADARALYEAGVQLLLIEAVPPEVAAFIAAELPIPVLGIGAGEQVDGQLLIVSDVLGTFQAFTPKFVRKYADLAGVATSALTEYVADVRAGAVPRGGALLPHARGRARTVPGLRRRARVTARLASAPAHDFACAERVDHLGTETVFAVAAEAAALAARGRTVYPFHLGDLNIATPANIAEATTRAMRDGKTTYCPNAGIPQLREAIAADVSGSHGLRYGVDNVSIQTGGKPVIGKFLLTLDEPRRRGALSQPGLSDLQLAHRVLRRSCGALHLRRGA